MPRALSRDEQAILTLVRRTGGSIPVPDLAAKLGLTIEAAQAACDYLISRSLLQATVYAVAAPAVTKRRTTVTGSPLAPAARS